MALTGPSTQKEHMSTQQPEALRLAEILELGSRQFNKEAAAELRRLHALNAELLEALQAMTEIAEMTIGWLPTPPNADGPLIQARAAITKAEGREA